MIFRYLELQMFDRFFKDIILSFKQHTKVIFLYLIISYFIKHIFEIVICKIFCLRLTSQIWPQPNEDLLLDLSRSGVRLRDCKTLE